MVPGSPASVVVEGGQAWREWRRAGRFYERAASIYARVGMSALAKRAYDAAADCWLAVGDEDLLEIAERQAAEIDVYWEDDDA